LRDLYKDLDVVTKIFESKLEGSRRKERPRLRWLEDVENRWQQKADDRKNGIHN